MSMTDTVEVTADETGLPGEDTPVEAPDAPDAPDEGTDDDETPEPAPDEDEEPPHAGPLSEEDAAQVFDKAIKRAKTYMSAVPSILGESAADLELCPRCTDLLPGFILPLRIKPVPDEQKIAVKQSIGELVAPTFRQDKHSSVCPDCDGEGKVATGSHVQRFATATCEACDGRGWIGPRAARVAAAPQAQQAGNGVTPQPLHEEPPVQDPWGRFSDDPLYGVMPGFERS